MTWCIRLAGFTLLVLAFAACGNSTTVSGPTVTVHCNTNPENRIGGDTTVDTKCDTNHDNPANSGNTTTTPPAAGG